MCQKGWFHVLMKLNGLFLSMSVGYPCCSLFGVMGSVGCEFYVGLWWEVLGVEWYQSCILAQNWGSRCFCLIRKWVWLCHTFYIGIISLLGIEIYVGKIFLSNCCWVCYVERMKNHELVQEKELIEMSIPEELIHLHKKLWAPELVFCCGNKGIFYCWAIVGDCRVLRMS
jgi:hypothetical protein